MPYEYYSSCYYCDGGRNNLLVFRYENYEEYHYEAIDQGFAEAGFR